MPGSDCLNPIFVLLEGTGGGIPPFPEAVDGFEDDGFALLLSYCFPEGDGAT